ncbi:MAG: 4Fe-4S ferredoxin [Candidatus Micrarchaeota archaeon]|nr:4Fe-4S ferredoxin [Candidatus Micrarchaeota archaeon]
MADDKKFSEWHGIPRERIKWNPAVDERKCTGCGMCATGCGRNVYDWSFEQNKPVVARPNNCLVGCVTCSNTCLFGAIAFPDKERLRKVIIENGVLAKAKNELKAKFQKGDVAVADQSNSYTCKKCGYHWIPKEAEPSPKLCPECADRDLIRP